jgi:hypothetical protein
MTVGRFQVMAVLQAARAHALGLPLESAHSWGLNRAIFYAAAKRGFKGKGEATGHPKAPGEGGRQIHGGSVEAAQSAGEYHLGDELAYKDKRGTDTSPIFSFGGEAQTEEDFKRQVETRFQGSFRDAWEDALDYVKHFDRQTLESQSGFFSDVYRPKRDEFAKKWTEMSDAKGSGSVPTGKGSTRK